MIVWGEELVSPNLGVGCQVSAVPSGLVRCSRCSLWGETYHVEKNAEEECHVVWECVGRVFVPFGVQEFLGLLLPVRGGRGVAWVCGSAELCHSPGRGWSAVCALRVLGSLCSPPVWRRVCCRGRLHFLQSFHLLLSCFEVELLPDFFGGA